MKRITSWVAVGVFAITLAAGTAFAARDHGPRGMRAAGGPQSMGEAMLEHWDAALELNEQQRLDLEALVASQRASMAGAREELLAAKETLSAQVHNDVFNEGAIRAAAASVASLEADLAVAAAGLLSEARAILTPDQLETAKALKAEHDERRRERRRRMLERMELRRH